MTRKLLWPYVRQSILGCLQQLTDEEFRKSWFSATAKHRFSDSLDFYIFDYLYNTPRLYSEADEMIGVALYDQDEATTLQKFMEFYHDDFEVDMTDSYYITHPEWKKLLSEAERIIKLMEENNKKYNFAADMEDYNLELQKEDQKKISERIDSVEVWSEEEKQSLKNELSKIFTVPLQEELDIKNKINKKIRIAKGESD
jgi:hypothetical protein